MKTLLSIIGLALVGCASADPQTNGVNYDDADNGGSAAVSSVYAELVSKTAPYPDAYVAPADRQGVVTEITYQTRDYTGRSSAIRSNNAFIYLPYGYGDNPEQRYNVLYLVHGHYGNASTFFSAEGGLLRNVLDHMTENGDIAPTIVVTPTYNYGEPTANYVDADIYCRALPEELRNDLVPLVESRYHTYAGSTDAAGIASSRSHRAIGGFSMGGVTTWYALDETLDLFRYFIPMSGDCWSLGAFAGMNRPQDTASYLANRIEQQGYGASDFYIWAASGTSDSAYRETLNQIEGMAQNSMFTLQNMTFHEKDNARHEYAPMVEYLYNALQFIFPPTDRVSQSR